MTELIYPEMPEHSLVVLIGPSGAGKSTIARTWSASQVLSLDVLREVVSDDFAVKLCVVGARWSAGALEWSRGGGSPVFRCGGCQSIESEFATTMRKMAKAMNTVMKSSAQPVLAASFPGAGTLAVARSGRSGR